jgi:hypothetical protein
MLSFGTNETISSLEIRLRELTSDKDTEELFLTPNIRVFTPGTEAALFQLILTWAAFSQARTIVTQVAGGIDIEKMLSSIVDCDYTLIAFIGARAVKGAGGTDISAPALKIARKELSRPRLPFSAEDRARCASLIVAHASLAPSSYAPYLHLATRGERSPRSEAFNRHIDHRLQSFYGNTSTVPLFGRTSDLPSILYELFANAEEWGCTNLRKEPVKIPLRGISLRVHAIPSRLSGAEDPLSTFVDGLTNNSECKYLLEASVFDSGIGMAQQYLKERIPAEEPIDRELEAVRACLAKHTSSSASTSRGLGLHHVMDLTSNMKGFLRLRTGRLHLYRDLQQNPYFYQSVRSEERMVHGRLLQSFQSLADWESRSMTSATVQPYAKGTLFTLILPMREAQPSLFK